MSTLPLSPTRRSTLFAAAALAIAPWALGAAWAASMTEAKFKDSPFRKITDAQWKTRLPAKAYEILRHEDTEPGGTGPLLHETHKGTYHCLGCDLLLFQSGWKFEHDDWPSFFDVVKSNIGTKVDHLNPAEVRTEYHCARCLGHHGHIFKDGPKPTGLRYCNNGNSLKFVPA